MANYIVSNWTDFLTYNSSGNTIKFANPHEENGRIVLEGDGTQNNPFIVSTYEEMLFATEAISIYQVKLVDRETKKYKYGNVYCIYNDNLTTIDFNNERSMPPGGYTSSLEILADVDFNGWTLFNMAVNGTRMRFANAVCKNLRLLNFLVNSYCNDSILNFGFGAINTIIDMVISNNTSYQQGVFVTSQSESLSIRQSSINIRTTTNSGSIVLNGMLTDCIINFDVTSEIVMSGCDFSRTLCTGKISTPNNNSFTWGDDVTNSIFFFFFTNGQPYKANWVLSSSFFNKEKCSETYMTAPNLYGATTEELKSATWLFNHGFPIGVD